jgi:RHS repeat-associated protein
VTYAYDALNRPASVSDAATGVSTYSFDAAGNLTGTAYPNGVTNTYTYTKRNLLTGLAAARGATRVAGYTYTLDPTGRRLSVADLNGRAATYTYDAIYRMTGETVTGAPSGPNGSVSYTYDPVGNRLQTGSTLAGIASGSFTYEADDHLTADTYDADGNTTSSAGVANTYDFENHLIQHGAVTIVYDGDGNRVSKTAGGVTTKYLVSELNPTGLAQVIEESGSDGSNRKLVYGLQRISQKQFVASSSSTLTSFYVYDGLGSVRALTDASGTITDTNDYDAFGNLIHTTGSTPNEFRFAGEQYDTDLGLYYNRARYMNPSTGRFFSMDIIDGDPGSPITLNKYLYGNGDPVNVIDPTGNDGDLGSLMTSIAINATLTNISTAILQSTLGHSVLGFLAEHLLPAGYFDFIQTEVPDAALVGASANFSLPGVGILGSTGFGGLDLVVGRNLQLAAYYYEGFGSTFGENGTGVTGSVYVGALWNTPSSGAYSGPFFNVGFPVQVLPNIISTKVKQDFLAATDKLIHAAFSKGNFNTQFLYLLLQAAGAQFLDEGTITFFLDPTKVVAGSTDSDHGFGSTGFSLAIGGVALGTGSTSISVTLSFFTQFYPFSNADVSFK